MKKLSYLILLALILGLVLTGCSLLSNVGQVPATEQSGIAYLTKGPYTGLVGLWSFDEGTGDKAYDSSGYGNDGTITGATYVGSVNAVFDYALSFNGSGDYVDCGSNVGSFDLLEPFTIEAWINPALNNKNGIIYGNAWAEPGYHVRVTLENKVRFILIQTGSIYKGIDSSVLTAGWHHIAAVCDGTSVKIYVDGEDDSQIAIENGTVTTITTAVNTKIGLDTASAAHYFNGIIDEVRIWDINLEPDMIKDHAAGIYGFNGLMAPYAPPDQKTFKFGRTIPLKWQYTDFDGNIVDSVDAYPVVEYQFADMGNGVGELELTDDPGLSGLRYNIDTKTWQFNWQTKGLEDGAGTYKIWITSIQTGQVNGPFLIELQ